MTKIIDCGLPLFGAPDWHLWVRPVLVALTSCPQERLMLLHKMAEGQRSPSTVVPPQLCAAVAICQVAQCSTSVHSWTIHLPPLAWQ